MDIVVDWLLKWGLSNPGAQYPAGSSEPVFIDASRWRTFSVTSFAVVVAVVCLGIAACHLPTRQVGQAFLRRWWAFAAAAALASGAAVFGRFLGIQGFVNNRQIPIPDLV